MIKSGTQRSQAIRAGMLTVLTRFGISIESLVTLDSNAQDPFRVLPA